MSNDTGPRDNVELVSWVLLAAATVGSAWCAYQASCWNSQQIGSLASASVAQFASSARLATLNRDASIDVGTFIAYVQADLHGDTKVTRFLRDHARPEFKPALEAWIGDQSTPERTRANPFARPEYRSRSRDEMASYDARAAAAITDANRANRTSDLFVLHTVLFALSLFFLGATSQARRPVARKAALTFGALVFTVTVISVLRLPVAA
jgi:hypothetical protein